MNDNILCNRVDFMFTDRFFLPLFQVFLSFQAGESRPLTDDWLPCSPLIGFHTPLLQVKSTCGLRSYRRAVDYVRSPQSRSFPDQNPLCAFIDIIDQ